MSSDLSVADDAVEIVATVKTTDRTGVEMEALTAVSVAALTVIDMVKAVDKGRSSRTYGWKRRRAESRATGAGHDGTVVPRARGHGLEQSRRGVYEDKGGPLIAEGLTAYGFEVDGPGWCRTATPWKRHCARVSTAGTT